MNYKGAYDANEDYNEGDVVVFTDDIPYVAIVNPPTGKTCHDKMYWNRVEQPLSDVVTMFHGAFGSISEAIPHNINDEAITLKTDDGEYLITVDDSGDTPELVVTEIEEEAEEEGGDT